MVNRADLCGRLGRDGKGESVLPAIWHQTIQVFITLGFALVSLKRTWPGTQMIATRFLRLSASTATPRRAGREPSIPIHRHVNSYFGVQLPKKAKDDSPLVMPPTSAPVSSETVAFQVLWFCVP